LRRTVGPFLKKKNRMPALFQGEPARLLGGLLLVTGLSATSVAQEPRRPRQPVVLNADDVPAFPEPPAGSIRSATTSRTAS
jgi:hypothetical protein